MKIYKYILLFPALFCIGGLSGQNGLEGIIVEKYYVSGPNDTIGGMFNGFLPVNSTTYRIFVDMLPGYRFQAAYGTADHELRLETTSFFFNNEDIGNKIPNVIPRRTLHRNTVMLDSWLSAGAGGEGMFGILKEQDDSLETIVHDKPYLQNVNKSAGIPIKDRDGLVAGTNIPWPAFYGEDSLVKVFFKKKASSFITKNGAWACLEGAVGPDSLTTNRVLIAQLTTDGDLTFELNIQIGKRNLPAENYVAKNPVEKEIMLPSLTYRSKETKITASKNKKPAQKK